MTLLGRVRPDQYAMPTGPAGPARPRPHGFARSSERRSGKLPLPPEPPLPIVLMHPLRTTARWSSPIRSRRAGNVPRFTRTAGRWVVSRRGDVLELAILGLL